MKEGLVSIGRSSTAVTSSRLVDLSSAHLSMAPSAVTSWVGAAPVAQFSSGPSCGQGRRGACRSKGLVAGQHVPDRFSEPAADLDRCQLRAALVAVAGAEALADRPVARVTGGAVRGLDECPAQVIGPVLAQRSTAVTLARLLDPRAEAGVADELARALYEGGPGVNRAFVDGGHLLALGGSELGSSLYGTVGGDELGRSCSGSAIQFGAVMRPRTRGRLPEQRARCGSACARSPR